MPISPNDADTSLPDPLSSSELAILLALPRAAEATPGATIFKIPHGPDPNLGFVHVSCAEAAAIVSRLAAIWHTRLSNLGLHFNELNIAIAVEPPINAFFHHLALWSLGCCVQYFNAGFEAGFIDTLLKEGGCAALLHGGTGVKGLAEGVRERLGVTLIEITEKEYAIKLATQEKEETGPAPPWPSPRRPTPSVILHSSASTNKPKLLRLSLQYWADNLEAHSKLLLLSGSSSSEDVNRTRLLASPPYWHTFVNLLVLHLTTRVPVALVHSDDLGGLTPSETMNWLAASESGQIVTNALNAREMLCLAFNPDGTVKDNRWAAVLAGLNIMGITGSDIDEELSEFFVKCNVKAMNLFGTSELGGLLLGTRPPYHYLRPYPDIPPPLAVPFSDEISAGIHTSQARPNESDGAPHARLVELWTLVSSHPRLAHMLAQNEAPLTIEPYPGPGAAHGQPATKWSDLFYELRVPLGSRHTGDTGGETEIVYLHAGRTDDIIRLSSNGGDLNAFEVETALSTSIRSELERLVGWDLDILQVFGTNRPHTALVIQLHRTGSEDSNGASSHEDVVTKLRRVVEEVNHELNLSEDNRIDAYKRVLVVTQSGQPLVTADEEGKKGAFEDKYPSLSTTHKRSVQRWKNAQAFEPWLEQVCGRT